MKKSNFSCLNRLYFGTWQFSGGRFKNLSIDYIEALIHFALNVGISRFDTAAVYGEGMVEKILGATLPHDTMIVTKIPAIAKPDLQSSASIQDFYSKEAIQRSVMQSLERLQRSSIDTLLLHNWHPSWSMDAIEILEFLLQLKKEGITKRIGVSLPNNFSAPLSLEVLPYFDVIEAPFNPQEEWVVAQISQWQQFKKEILLRSLFCQGKLLKNQTALPLLQKALSLNTSVVIGMTTQEQISQNIASFLESSLASS